jgi:hypothetical protein
VRSEPDVIKNIREQCGVEWCEKYTIDFKI